MSDSNEPGVILDSTGLHVSSDAVAKKLEKKNLSPSLVTGLSSCAARWFGESFVIRDLIQEEPDSATRRGSLFHKVMEDFFTFPPEERTTQRMKLVVAQTLKSDEFKDMAKMPEAIEWLKVAISNYYNMGGKPEKVQVASIKNKKGEDTLGLEVFVKGKIGNTNRDILGFIDRLIVDPRKSTPYVAIEDWKTGAKVKRWDHTKKSTDGLGEARQQVVYAMLLEKQGINVTGARLIFPVAKEIVYIDVHNPKIRKRVISDVEEADQKLDIMIDRNTFEYTPSFLCAWCPLAKVCPSATIKPYDKMQAAYATQPDPDILLKGFEIR